MREREEFRQAVPCRDTADRERSAYVFVTGAGDIAIQAPPGETALFAPSQINGFKAAVNEAHIVAIKVRES
jgi:hypothetical protein